MSISIRPPGGRSLASGVLVGVILLGGACSSGPTASPPPTPPAVPGLTWQTALVERPADAFALPSALPTGPSGPGTAGHPGHFPGQSIVEDVATAPSGLVAVGYVGLEGRWNALSWGSADGRQWALATIDAAKGSFAVAVSSAPDGVVAVGRAGPDAVAWTSTDGRAWQRHVAPHLDGSAEWERMTAILAVDGGFLAGGSVGPELGDRRARFWRSSDGADWQSIPDVPAFAGAEVAAIAPFGGDLVALGRLGTGQRATGSIAWLSGDGRRWERIADPQLAGGLAVELAAGPGGDLVAVGSDLDEREAVAWRSSDGRAWQRAPGEPSRLHSGEKIRMTDVVMADGRLIAVGNYVGVQFGTATSWLSTDGRSWEMGPRQPQLNGAEMLGIAAAGSGFVATGSYGAPDNYIPTIWVSPPP